MGGRAGRRVLSFVGVFVASAACGVFAGTVPAAADVVEPEGNCVGNGSWDEAGFNESSTDHEPDDTIVVPRSDTVLWEGYISTPGQTEPPPLGTEVARRAIEGRVELELPAPLGWVTIDDWGGTSIKVINEGEHSYDLPSVLAGIKMKLRGEHSEGGTEYCAGSVYVEIEGSTFGNPLTYASLIGTAGFAALLLYSGRIRFTKHWAYEDVNRT